MIQAATYEIVDGLLKHIETDAAFQAFSKSAFGNHVTRGSQQAFSRDRTTRLEHLFRFPDDWDKVKFNQPLHVYVTIDSQTVEEEHAYFTPKITHMSVSIRFMPNVEADLIYKTTDALQRCIRRFDSVTTPLWENLAADFDLIENGYPLVTLTVGITHIITDCEGC